VPVATPCGASELQTGRREDGAPAFAALRRGRQRRGYTRNFLVHILRHAFVCAKDWQHGKWRDDRVLRAGTPGPDALELVALADRPVARRDVDS